MQLCCVRVCVCEVEGEGVAGHETSFELEIGIGLNSTLKHHQLQVIKHARTGGPQKSTCVLHSRRDIYTTTQHMASSLSVS